MIHPSRIIKLNPLPVRSGPVMYWMNRDQRVKDNWALIYAQQMALELRQPLLVVFFTREEFPSGNLRQHQFILSGLSELATSLQNLNITFIHSASDPVETLEKLTTEFSPGLIITEFNPLHLFRRKMVAFTASCSVSVAEVDTHNIVPCRFVSDKEEYGAYTIRPKISRLLHEFITPFPDIIRHPFTLEITSEATDIPASKDQKTHFSPVISGESAAGTAMKNFLSGSLSSYHDHRNDPNLNGQSNLSPYLHFGQISAQRIVIEILSDYQDLPSSASFLEELIIRRELSDNFCFYNDRYDDFEGFPAWAKKTLNEHRNDRREFLYSPENFEKAETHDGLWNAAQQELLITGKMHGYMRMYWAKKILEWTHSPEEALAIAIWLNDKYSIDGNDPNGYAGIAWSVGGLHDRAWGERPVFGKIRYMNEKGCRRKFDVESYKAKIWSIAGL